MQHKHHDLIVDWAKGAAIQYNDKDDGFWYDTTNPSWCNHAIYRIKPEPKPDVVLYACCETEKISHDSVRLKPNTRANGLLLDSDNIMLIFDGETGALKDAQVLAKLVV